METNFSCFARMIDHEKKNGNIAYKWKGIVLGFLEFEIHFTRYTISSHDPTTFSEALLQFHCD